MSMLPPTAGPGQVPHSKDHLKHEDVKDSAKNGSARSAKAQILLGFTIGPYKAYFIDLPMVDLARHTYEQAVENRSSEINRFISMKHPDDPTVTSIDRLILDLKKCLSQEYIVAGLFTKRQRTPADIAARWATTYSTKHIFLHRFLNKIRNFNTHIAIFAAAGEHQDILQSILKTDHITYIRPGMSDISPQSKLQVTLIPTRQKRGHKNVSYAQLVIAFDDTFNPSDTYVRRVCKDLHTNNISPIVFLTISNSIEQINARLPGNMASHKKKCLLLRCVEHTVLERKVGVQNPKNPSLEASMTYLAQFLASGVQELTLPIPLQLEEINSYLQKLEKAFSVSGNKRHAGEAFAVPDNKRHTGEDRTPARSKINLERPQRNVPGESEHNDGKQGFLKGDKHNCERASSFHGGCHSEHQAMEATLDC